MRLISNKMVWTNYISPKVLQMIFFSINFFLSNSTRKFVISHGPGLRDPCLAPLSSQVTWECESFIWGNITNYITFFSNTISPDNQLESWNCSYRLWWGKLQGSPVMVKAGVDSLPDIPKVSSASPSTFFFLPQSH